MQTNVISNKRCSAPFNQKHCNPGDQETGHMFCWPFSSYSQDGNLILQIGLPWKSSSPFCLPYLPFETIASIIVVQLPLGIRIEPLYQTKRTFTQNTKNSKKNERLKIPK